jgi:hypothetical protein
MFANRHGASAEWTRALPAIALSAAIAALSGLPTVTCILSAAEPDGGMVSGRKLSGGAEPKQTTLPPKSSVRGHREHIESISDRRIRYVESVQHRGLGHFACVPQHQGNLAALDR